MTELIELDRGACLRLLAGMSGRVGRIALNVPDWPAMIRPVNYAFDEESQSVVFRLAPGSILRGILSSTSAAFEIDGADPVERTGWSVIVVGLAEEVTDRAEVERIEGLELESWAPGFKGHWARIPATSATGRRVVRGSEAGPDHRV